MIKERYDAIMGRIRRATVECGRSPEAVRLVAVSKTVPADRVLAAIEAGMTVFGENYIQEARDKIDRMAQVPVSWHFIGHLQSNKAKYAVPIFDLIHSVDSFKLALEIDKQARKHGKTQDILIQVNVSGEASKSGIEPGEALALAGEIAGLEHVALRGLMTMPPFFDDPERARPYFRALRQLADRIRQEGLAGVGMDELSMGMTGDFEAAIEEGATLVRIGTAIFGERG
jgi:pyridoxal phosphate enzyme (YggS family)